MARMRRADRARGDSGHTSRLSPFRVLVATAVLLLAVVSMETLETTSRRSPTVLGSCVASPLAAREVARLSQFTSWLKRNNAAGYVGEVGWPSGPPTGGWNDVAQRWYRAATAAELWVTAWSASGWWPADYPMAAYRLPAAGSPGSIGSQAAVISQFPAGRYAVRGVDVPTGAFGTADDGDPSYSNRNRGTLGVDYSYESPAAFAFLAQHGVATVRLSVTWERLQPKIGGDLDPQGVARLVQAINDASQAALGVIVDLHGFGGYWAGSESGPTRLALGSANLPTSALADFWARLVVALKGAPGILGYGLMNEPGGLATDPGTGVAIWEDASQRAVNAIRATGDAKTVLVSGYGGSSPEAFEALQPRAWIVDPAHNVRYEAHQYFDTARSGRYALSYAQESSTAASDIGCPE
ncbi:MAG: Cellulase [Jatrophihabitantaceae bacterium]|nr:Cellulase [Jatrophihabitantaceae bacterium]